MVLPFFPVDISSAPPFDPGVYPRTYRVSSGYRVFLGFLGGIGIMGGSIAVWYFGTGHEMPSTREAVVMAAVFSPFVLLGTYLLGYIARYCVTLRADAIVVQEVFTSRTLFRADIAGRRILPTKYVSTLILIPRPNGGKKLKIGMSLKTDYAFHAWLTGISDLDAEDLAESKKSLAVDPDLGFESEDRAQRVERARKIAKSLNVVAFVALLWGFLYPHPYAYLIPVLAVLPLVALALLVRSQGIYQIDEYRNDARPSLGLLFIGPGLALAMRALLDLNLLQWKTVLLIALLLAAVMVIPIVRADRGTRKRPWNIAIIFLLSIGYGYGLAVHTNALLDNSSAQVFQVAVVDKHVSEGKSTTYYLHLDPWGPQTGVTEVDVPASLYNATPRGATVCVYLHPGALRIPWYLVDRCS